MIYLDTSVVLAQLLAEDQRPPEDLWLQPLVSSRLLEYEVWNRLNSRGLAESHGEEARSLFDQMTLVELAPPRDPELRGPSGSAAFFAVRRPQSPRQEGVAGEGQETLEEAGSFADRGSGGGERFFFVAELDPAPHPLAR